MKVKAQFFKIRYKKTLITLEYEELRQKAKTLKIKIDKLAKVKMKGYHSTKTPSSKERRYRLGKIHILQITDNGLEYMKNSFKLIN